MAFDVRIPQLGESIAQGVIARWLKQQGDLVTADEPLLELETDKAAMEIPAGAAGRVQILAPEGSTVAIGTVVARILADTERPAAAPVEKPSAAPSVAGDGGQRAPAREPAQGRPEPAQREPALSPAVRKLVSEQQLDPSAITGTGKGGRLTKGDVLRQVEESRRPAVEPAAAEAAERAEEFPARPAPAAPAAEDEVERVRMSTLRQRIAERLVEAQRTAAILTTFNEVDLSELLALRKRHRERFQQRHGVDLGLMSLFGRAAILALRDVPVVNAKIDGADIVLQRRVHLGIAVSTKRGLVVPVVRNADHLSLAELERAIGELARVAREGKIAPDQLAGGTFTITNGGVFGSLLSTPLLNPPQSGILGMHKIEDRPVAVQGQVMIRPMMYVALSYDHRLVDGEQAVTFLVRVKERLEDPGRMLLDV
jgi:2-oxoglutarate dehydrogenase E2 component (dihydrolipoamide succinyltransferase)